jgi:hypothetical protein
MPIALALPFAEAAGIAVAGLSAAAIANKVSEYIKLNPEDSMMILKMINPASGGAFAGEGISTLFKKKAKTEKEPSIEDLEEIGEDLSQSDKAKVMKAYGKSKGADKRQRMIDIAKKLGLAGEEKERQKSFDEVEGRYEDSDFEEERTKPKFDYTKFFKADGGRIGYVGGGLATTQDFANALKSVSAGTTYQQQTQAKEYARNEAANELRAAIQGGGIDSFLGGAGLSNYRSMFPNDRAGTNRQGDFTGTYNARKEQLLDALMNKKLQFTSYAPPPPPTDSLTGMLESQMLPNMADGSMKSLAEQNAIRDRVLAAQKAQEESYYLTDPISGKKYTSQDEAINDLGLVTYNQRFADGGRIGFANGGENIIGADLKDPDTEMNQNTEMNQMIPPGGINFSNIKNYASIPATYGAALYGNYINQRVGENMARAFRTDEMNERLSQQVGDKLSPGINSGSLTYTDFGLDPVREYIGGGEFRNTRDFNPPSFEKAMSLNSADLANALTLGNLNFNKDPSGNINYTGNTFDFPQPTFMNNNPVDIPLDELNVNAPQFSFTDYLQGNYDLNKSPTTDIVVPERTAPATYYNSAPNFNANVLLEEEDAQYNLPQKNIFQRAGNFIGKLNLEDYLPFIGQKSLTGTMGRGIGNLFQNIAPARYGTSQQAYNALTPQGRSTVGSIYGPGGIMSGYNAVSAFGRGPIGAIDNRIGNIYNRRAPQTDASKKTIQDLYKAREKIMQTTLDSDKQYTGPKSSPRGQKAGVMDDDPFGGTSGTTGGSSKIVCTMMNESYGFGNFRNKIWLKHSKDLPKEYEIGYHTIFLPLVNFAKKEGKVNKLVKKILEHIAKHRTIDLKQEMRGKTHTLGRVYRKILEPICLMVGKIKKEVK